MALADGEAEIAARVVEVLRAFEFDLPFSLFHRLDPAQGCYHLAAHHGVRSGATGTPLLVEAGAESPWPFAEALVAAPHIVEVGGVRSLMEGEANSRHASSSAWPPSAASRACSHARWTRMANHQKPPLSRTNPGSQGRAEIGVDPRPAEGVNSPGGG